MKWIAYFISKTWSSLDEESQCFVWTLSWMIPFFMASLFGGHWWTLFLVIFVADLVWFAYDTYVTIINEARKKEREKLKKQSHEMLKILYLNNKED